MHFQRKQIVDLTRERDPKAAAAVGSGPEPPAATVETVR